ncbi:MAG: hypothetical protein AB7E41_16915 [Mycolicibacterium sp.]
MTKLTTRPSTPQTGWGGFCRLVSQSMAGLSTRLTNPAMVACVRR